MVKIRPASFIASLSGKLDRREDIYVRTYRRTGNMQLVVVENPYHGPWSDAQIAHRAAFGKRSKTASQWLKDNDPKRNGGTATEEYKAMLAKYYAQHDIGNIFAFVSKHYRDGEIQTFL